MSRPAPDPTELSELRKALDSVAKPVNIRLREGEHQFNLAKAIAFFELELCFPDVKDLTKKLYGERNSEDQQFLNKIQTILKKMEKSGVVRILPKKKPWELQRYTLTSFGFLDVEKNEVYLATNEEKEEIKHAMNSPLESQLATTRQSQNANLLLYSLIGITVTALTFTIWTLAQSPISLTMFLAAFVVAVMSSAALGILIGRKYS